MKRKWEITCSYDKKTPVKKLNVSKAADIQRKTLLKNKFFHHRYFARFLSGTLSSGSSRTKEFNQPSFIMESGKPLKPVRLKQHFFVTTLVFWKLKTRCRMKWLWVESHFTARLSRYAWISNTSLIYGMTISLFFIWMNLKIFIFVIQDCCFANILLKKIMLIPLMLKTFVLYQTSYKFFWKHTTYSKTKSIAKLNTGEYNIKIFN